jgi:photosystem II stability/assembly factor-like uncharacterized protein
MSTKKVSKFKSYIQSCFLILTILVGSGSVSSAQKWEVIAEKPLTKNFGFHSISVVNKDVVWLIANNYDLWENSVDASHTIKVMRTTDGGATWKYYDVAEAKGRASLELFAIDSLTAWFSTNRFENTDTRPIFKTIDGGLSWKKIETPSAAGGNLIHFFDKNDGIVINGSSAAVSKNGGEIWTKISASKYALRTGEFLVVNGTATSRAAYTDSTIVLGTTLGRIIYSKDRGQSWTFKQVAATNDFLNAITMINESHWIAVAPQNNQTVYVNAKVFETLDGGISWSELTRNQYGIYHIAKQYGSEKTIFTGSFNDMGIKMSTTAMDSAVWEETLEEDQYCYGIAFSSEGIGYAVSYTADEENYILKWNQVPSNTKDNPKVALNILIFPNPTSGMINIPNPLTVQRNITIFDNTGAMVIRFLNTDKMIFDISSLLVGNYYLEVEYDGKKDIVKLLKVN